VSRISDSHKAVLDWITPEAERIIAKHARVSTKIPDRVEVKRLLNYCISNGHVSVFEQASASFEIITSRSISAQIIRHRSFCFQEASQRYCDPLEVLSDVAELAPEFELRRQDTTNRQNSIAFENSEIETKFRDRIRLTHQACTDLYQDMLASGVAKECARNILPMCTATRIHMQGNIRNWVHYVGLRSAPGTQLEHRVISNQIGRELRNNIPIIIEGVIEATLETRAHGLNGWLNIDDL
jgi:thymidylate synthase (FAD)